MLTKKQRQELNKAILAYFSKTYPESAALFSKEAGLVDPPDSDSVLERKWSTIARLQQKLTESQKKIQQLQELLNQGGVNKRPKAQTGEQIYPALPEKKVMSGHRGNINWLALHPNFTEAATGSQDCRVMIWDYDQGQLQRTLMGHQGAVNCVTYQPNGKYLVSCSSDISIKIWDCNSDYVCIKTLVGHDHSVSSVNFSQTGDLLLSASRDKTIKIWDFNSGFSNSRTLIGHQDWVRCALFTHSGSQVVSCSTDQTIIVWKLQNGSCQLTIRAHDHVIDFLSLIEDQRASLLLTESDLLKKRRLQVKKEDHAKEFFIVSCSRDKTIKLFSGVSGDCFHTFIGHDNWVRAVDFHSSGKFMYSASDDKTVRVWDLLCGKQARKIQAHQFFVLSLKYSNKFRVLLTSGADKTVKLWNLT